MSRTPGPTPAAVNLPSSLWALASLEMPPCVRTGCVRTTWRGGGRRSGKCCRPAGLGSHKPVPQFRPAMGLGQSAQPGLQPGRIRAWAPGGKMGSSLKSNGTIYEIKEFSLRTKRISYPFYSRNYRKLLLIKPTILQKNILK